MFKREKKTLIMLLSPMNDFQTARTFFFFFFFFWGGGGVLETAVMGCHIVILKDTAKLSYSNKISLSLLA